MAMLEIERVSNGYIVTKDKNKEVHQDLDKLFDEIKRSLTLRFSNQRPKYLFTYEIKEDNITNGK